MSSYLTDNAISDIEIDGLDFGDFRPALKEILTKAETPLTVGIFGAWGSGKTSLMRMLRDEIESAGLARQRTVWFTAWKYDRQDALWRAFILRILDALYPRESEPKDKPREERPILQNPTAEKQIKLIKLLGHMEDSVYQAVEWTEQGEWEVDWFKLLGYSGKAALELAATVKTAGLYPQVKQLIGGDDSPLDDIQKAAQAISRETRTFRRHQLFHMEQFEENFKEAVQLDDVRLIVFVDDLDRCLPEKAIEILEAIKLFLEVKGVVFVLGMDREVVQRGVEARYGHFFHQGIDRDQELPISGDSYLQKIVQIPFHLPALAIGRLDGFIAGLDTELDETTRQVFAHGLYPNPRQVKRALNIFHLLQQIALEREKRPVEEGGLPKNSVAWPLLAKTVMIQTQYPELYQLWRQYPLIVRHLEETYSKHTDSEDERIRGRRQAAGAEEKRPEEIEGAKAAPSRRSGGLIDVYLENRQRYALLAQMLAYPSEEHAGEGRERARFAGLDRDELAAYVQLAGTVETTEEVPVDVPADLLAELLSGDSVKIQDAAGRLQSEEPEQDGPKHRAHRSGLAQILSDPGEPPGRRVSAGDALGLLGDERPGVTTLEPDLIPITDDLTFLMGQEKQQVTVPQPFAIARYPLTNAQFRFFVDDGGYTNRWQQCWTTEGWKYREDKHWTEPRFWNDANYSSPNQPVVGISWYEALAYAAWLAEKTAKPYRLPTEAEWERAARHSDGRTYPWGETWSDGIVNSEEAGIGRPSTVGAFPAGAAVCGALDMSGNVWEWCRTRWRDEAKADYPQPWADDGREDLIGDGSVWRVFRGGSWRLEKDYCPAAARYRFGPDGRDDSFGVRVVVSPFIPDSDL